MSASRSNRRHAVQTLPQHGGGRHRIGRRQKPWREVGRGIRRGYPRQAIDREPDRRLGIGKIRRDPWQCRNGGGPDRDRRSVLKAVVRQSVSNPLVEPDPPARYNRAGRQGSRPQFCSRSVPDPLTHTLQKARMRPGGKPPPAFATLAGPFTVTRDQGSRPRRGVATTAWAAPQPSIDQPRTSS